MPRATVTHEFVSRLFRYAGASGWHFATVPDKHAPPVTHGWGRTPVDAVVDGHAWKTSVWRTKEGKVLLAVPKRARGDKGDGDFVRVRITFDQMPDRAIDLREVTEAEARRIADSLAPRRKRPTRR